MLTLTREDVRLGCRASDWLVDAVRGGLGELVTPLEEARARASPRVVVKAPVVAPVADEPLTAVPAEPGLAIAPAYVLRPPEFHYPERAEDAARERGRLERALDEARRQLEALVRRAVGGEVAKILAIPEEPDLETQLSDYREAFDALAGRPLVARTLDVGGDKPLSYWPMAEEENPFAAAVREALEAV